VTLFALIVAFVAVATIRGSEAAPGNCAASATQTINDTSGTYGCAGSKTGVTMDWVFTADVGRIISYTQSGYADMTITVFGPTGTFFGPAACCTKNTWFFPKGQEMRLRWFAGGYSNPSYGLIITLAPAPEVNTLVSSQQLTLTKEQPGGFVYFMLPPQSQGRQYALDVQVYSYKGLREPSVYVCRNKMPTLESFDYTNTTVSVAGREQFLLFVEDPPAALWTVGVFLYGQAASMSVRASWIFSMEHLQSGVQVSSAATSTTLYYQVIIPMNTPKLTFQISRQAPGGNVIGYIAQGTLASATNYQWIADTSKQSYISITIPNPNPTGSQSPNPGNYIFAITPDNTKCGFIMQVDW